MALSKRTPKKDREEFSVSVVTKTRTRGIQASQPAFWPFILFGVLFGYFLSKARATDYDSIVDMFLVRDFQLYGVIGVGILIVAGGLFLLERQGIPTQSGESLDWEPLSFKTDRLIGAFLFGAGWALAGTCPGTAVAQLGEGKLVAIFTVIGIYGGVWLFEKYMPADKDDDVC
jgi:hypothetical protein